MDIYLLFSIAIPWGLLVRSKFKTFTACLMMNVVGMSKEQTGRQEIVKKSGSKAHPRFKNLNYIIFEIHADFLNFMRNPIFI